MSKFPSQKKYLQKPSQKFSLNEPTDTHQYVTQSQQQFLPNPLKNNFQANQIQKSSPFNNSSIEIRTTNQNSFNGKSSQYYQNREDASQQQSQFCANKWTDEKDLPIQHLELNNFKVEICPLQEKHEPRRCAFFHTQKDRRRKGNSYLSEQCEKGDTCLSGDACQKAHNQVEIYYSKDQYKKKFCLTFPEKVQWCEFKEYCSFAHSEADVRIELIHHNPQDDEFYIFKYKTVFCPFREQNHQRDKCVYAHNYQDYRRPPDQFFYDPITCPHWPSKDKVAHYEDGCPQGYQCNKCHGWKELDYHSRTYRTKSCISQNPTCKKPYDCPYFHSQNEMRVIPQTVQQKIFQIVPKNQTLIKQKINTQAIQQNNGSNFLCVPLNNNSNGQQIQALSSSFVSNSTACTSSSNFSNCSSMQMNSQCLGQKQGNSSLRFQQGYQAGTSNGNSYASSGDLQVFTNDQGSSSLLNGIGINPSVQSSQDNFTLGKDQNSNSLPYPYLDNNNNNNKKESKYFSVFGTSSNQGGVQNQSAIISQLASSQILSPLQENSNSLNSSNNLFPILENSASNSSSIHCGLSNIFDGLWLSQKANSWDKDDGNELLSTESDKKVLKKKNEDLEEKSNQINIPLQKQVSAQSNLAESIIFEESKSRENKREGNIENVCLFSNLEQFKVLGVKDEEDNLRKKQIVDEVWNVE